MGDRTVAVVVALCSGITALLLLSAEVKGQQSDGGGGGGGCDLQSCFPKMTTNSSRLNALLVFGIFEVSLYEKCLSFAKADVCFNTTLQSCQGSAYRQRQRFHVDSWQNAKKLFDYICVDEFVAFTEHHSCLRELALSEGIRLCDSYFDFKSTGNAMCGLQSTLTRCVELETRKTCRDEEGTVVPKIVKMVDMFLSNMLSINSTSCAGLPSPDSGASTPSHASPLPPASDPPRQGATALPVHTFVVTRRRQGGRSSTAHKRRKNEDDDDDDEEDDLTEAGMQGGEHHFDRWYQGSPEHAAGVNGEGVGAHAQEDKDAFWPGSQGHRGQEGAKFPLGRDHDNDVTRDENGEDMKREEEEQFHRGNRSKLGRVVFTADADAMTSSAKTIASCLLLLLLLSLLVQRV